MIEYQAPMGKRKRNVVGNDKKEEKKWEKEEWVRDHKKLTTRKDNLGRGLKLGSMGKVW